MSFELNGGTPAECRQAILEALANGKINQPRALELFGDKRCQDPPPAGAITLGISPGGSVQIRGLRQSFGGLALYASEVDRITAFGWDKVVEFVKVNREKLSTGKDDKRFAEAKAASKAKWEARQTA